ncbi:MAG: hypothetical protein IJX46_04795 [Clostridia bacterium]|nr:hypothetical protein [Clostridia bacterium]
MVICNENIRNIPSLKFLVEENGAKAVLHDVWRAPYAFLKLIKPLMEDFIDEYGDSDIPVGFSELENRWDDGDLEEYINDNADILISIALKFDCSLAAECDKLRKVCFDRDVCVCLLIDLLCRPIGLFLKADDLLDILPHKEIETIEPEAEAEAATAEKVSSDPDGFDVSEDEVRYNGKVIRHRRTLAAGKNCVAYVDGDKVSVLRGKYVDEINCTNVGEIALYGDGDVLCARMPYREGENNLCSFTDDDIEDGDAVAISACGYQYAFLTHSFDVYSNIPFGARVPKDVTLVDISVSHNLVLGVTDDGRVFSSDDGMLPGYTNAVKAVAYCGSIAVLTSDGNVCFSGTGKTVSGIGAHDIAFTDSGLAILEPCGISLIDKNGRSRMLVEGKIDEMAAAGSRVIYRKSGSVSIIDL